MRFSFEDFDFASLTAAERLLLAQELLDSVFDEVSSSASARETAAPFNAEQMAEIRRRAADVDAGLAVGEPWETVRARLHDPVNRLSLLILPAAEADILATAGDYDARLDRLGQRFVFHVEQAIERIHRHPHSFQRLDEQFRRAVLNAFPYAVVYRVLADRIEIVAVFPFRMNPRRLIDRITPPSG